MLTRHFFNVNTDTGTWTDTGPPFMGAVSQMAWDPTTGDTGGDLEIWLMARPGDTGDGWRFYNDNDCLGDDFMKVPLQPSHGSDGNTTSSGQYFPIVGNGDRLRVKVTPGGAAVVGNLYIWTYSG